MCFGSERRFIKPIKSIFLMGIKKNYENKNDEKNKAYDVIKQGLFFFEARKVHLLVNDVNLKLLREKK